MVVFKTSHRKNIKPYLIWLKNGIIRYQNEKYISILIPSSPFSKSNAVIELLLSVKIIKSQFNNIALDKNDYFILSSNNNEFFIHNIPFSNDIHTIRAMDKEAPFTDMITINGTSYILFAENIPLLKSTFTDWFQQICY